MISLPIAFVAGLTSFFAPCVVPLLPAYVGYVTGVSLPELKEKGHKPFRKKILISSVFYILGFSLIFTLMGAAAAGVGAAFRLHAREFQIAGGVLIIIFGFEIAGLARFKIFPSFPKLTLPNWAEKLGYFRAFLIGIIFAATWTPCVGVILGSILALASVSQSAFQGGALLFAYSLGISLPFLAVSLTLSSAPRYLKFIQKRMELILRLSGIVLIFLGILLISGFYAHVNKFVFDIL